MDGASVTMDRFSDLPDQLLTHILTLLPTEEAVRTCVLSKRWINVWTSLQILDFNDHKDMEDDLTDEDFLNRDITFLLLVFSVLHKRENLPLDRFKLTWCGKFSVTHPLMSNILSYAALCMPRVLSLNITTDEIFILPDFVFACESVEEMSLEVTFEDGYEWYDDHIQAELIDLPCLKKLELRSMMINDDFIRMLLSGCPILEELVFYSCCFQINEISSPVLKKLTFMHCNPFDHIQISCPGVVSLYIDFTDTPGVTLKKMPSLVSADLYIVSTRKAGVPHDIKLLSGLSNATSLKLSTNLLMDLATDIVNCPNFYNLKSLDLGELDMNLHWDFVVCLLQHSPNLETLTLHFCSCRPSEDSEEEELPGDAAFQLEYLATLNLLCCKMDEEFFEEVVDRLNVFINSFGEVTICEKRMCYNSIFSR